MAFFQNKNKKPRVELVFEGIYRRSPGESLSFVAKQVGTEAAIAYTLEGNFFLHWGTQICATQDN